jgi:hypothetical protein
MASEGVDRQGNPGPLRQATIRRGSTFAGDGLLGTGIHRYSKDVYVDASPQVSAESTRSYVLTGVQAALKRDQEDLVRWWVEDECGNVPEFHDDFSPPAKPMYPNRLQSG